jgi:hypothetical protein
MYIAEFSGAGWKRRASNNSGGFCGGFLWILTRRMFPICLKRGDVPPKPLAALLVCVPALRAQEAPASTRLLRVALG